MSKILKFVKIKIFACLKKSGSISIWILHFWWTQFCIFSRDSRIWKNFDKSRIFQSLSYDVIGRQVEACFINITVDLHYNERIKTSDLFNFKGPAKIPPSPALWHHQSPMTHNMWIIQVIWFVWDDHRWRILAINCEKSSIKLMTEFIYWYKMYKENSVEVNKWVRMMSHIWWVIVVRIQA